MPSKKVKTWTALEDLPMDIMLLILWYLGDVKDVVRLSMVCSTLHNILNSDRSVWTALALSNLRQECCAPYSINFNTISLLELRLSATRAERLFAALRRGDAFMQRVRLNLEASYIAPGAKHWILPGGRWMLTLVPSTNDSVSTANTANSKAGKLFIWDLGSAHEELGTKKHDKPAVSFEFPEPYASKQLVLQTRHQELSVTVVIYDNIRSVVHILSIVWTKDPDVLPMFRYENKFETAGISGIEELPICIEEDYVLVAGTQGCVVWNWRVGKRLVLSAQSTRELGILPFQKFMCSLLTPFLILCDHMNTSKVRVINLDLVFSDVAFSDAEPTLNPSHIDSPSDPACFLILKEGVGLKPRSGRYPLYCGASWRTTTVNGTTTSISSFKPFVLANSSGRNGEIIAEPSPVENPSPTESSPTSSDRTLISKGQTGFHIMDQGPRIDTGVIPSVIYCFGNRVIYFALPEAYPSLKEAAKFQAVPDVPALVVPPASKGSEAETKFVLHELKTVKKPKIGSSIIGRLSTEGGTSPSAASGGGQGGSSRVGWKRIFRPFTFTKQPLPYALPPRPKYKGPVSSVVYQLFELDVRYSKTSTSPLESSTHKAPSLLSAATTSAELDLYDSASITSATPYAGRLAFEGGKAQKLREWCLITGRMAGHGDNVYDGAYTVDKDPSVPVDILVFR